MLIVTYLLSTNNFEFYTQLLALPGSNYAEHDQYYRLFTLSLLHLNFSHLFFNLFSLYQLGNVVEREFTKSKYLLLLLTLLFLSSLTSYIFMSPSQVSIGASGMIFGLFGYIFNIADKYGISKKSLYFFLLLNILTPIFIPNIDYKAHLGGLIAGYFIGKKIESKNKPL